MPLYLLTTTRFIHYMEAYVCTLCKCQCSRGTAAGLQIHTTGDEGSALYEHDYNATCSPPFFHQWKQVITPYPFTSLMGFSAMLHSAVMEHLLMKIHMASCLKISAILSCLYFFFVIFPSQTCWKMKKSFPLFVLKF